MQPNTSPNTGLNNFAQNEAIVRARLVELGDHKELELLDVETMIFKAAIETVEGSLTADQKATVKSYRDYLRTLNEQTKNGYPEVTDDMIIGTADEEPETDEVDE